DPWRDELDRGALDVAGIEVAGVRQPGDVGTAGADAVDLVATCSKHGSTGDTDDANVQRADRGRVTGDLHVRERGLAVLDRRHVAGCPTYLDDDRVGDAREAQDSCDGRRRPRVQRARRLAAEPVGIDGTTVAPHHHHGRVQTGRGDAALDELLDPDGDRQD